MTRPLEPLLLQAKKQGAQQTTTMRVLQMGMGLTGCVVENSKEGFRKMLQAHSPQPQP